MTDNNKDSVAGFSFGRIELPEIREDRGREWVLYGRDNLYPVELMKLMDSSAIHAAIVQAKATMVAGAGLVLNKLEPDASKEYLDTMEANAAVKIRKLFENPNSNETLHEIVYKIALDWQIFGALSLEITWSRDFTEIARVKHIPAMRVRSGKLIDGEVCEYFYSRDWDKHRQKGYEPVRLPAFSRSNKDEAVQLLYVRNERPDLDYYGSPNYNAAIGWINVDSQMALFHSNNITNGFTPSFVAKFYNPPPTPEAQQFIVNNLKKQFAGAENAGKAIVLFSDGKENAPDIEPIAVTNLDKQFLALGEQVVQQIISGHRVTSPMLLGIALPGKLGYSTELESAYKIFQSTVISPDQVVIEKILTKLLRINGVMDSVSITKFSPLA